MNNEFGKDVDGSRRGLFQFTGWKEPQKTSVKITGLQTEILIRSTGCDVR
jgi:hypothetical protein